MVFTVQDICSEMRDMSQLIKQRQKGAMSEQIPDFEQKVAKGIQGKIQKLQTLSAAEAMQLLKHLEMFGSETQQLLSAAIDSKVVEEVPAPDPGPAAALVRPQKHEFPHCWLLQEQWEKLEDPSSSYHCRVRVLCEALRSWGVVSCHEQTIKWCIALITAIVAQQTKVMPRYTVLYDAVKDFKAAFATTPIVPGRRQIMEYPEDPKTLGDGFMEQVFGNATPVPKLPERIVQIANFHIPLRSSSKLLKGETQASNPMLNLHQTVQGGNLIQELLAALGGVTAEKKKSLKLEMAAERDQNNQERAPRVPPLALMGSAESLAIADENSPPQSSPPRSPVNLGCFTFKPKTSPSPAASESSATAAAALESSDTPDTSEPAAPAAPAAPAPAGAPAGSDGSRISSEAYEMAAFNALMNGAKKARTKSQGNGCGASDGGKTLKKPAAAITNKRPAAAITNAASGSLLNGWTVEVVTRPDNTKDKYYHPPSPHSDKRLRSKPEVAEFCNAHDLESPF